MLELRDCRAAYGAQTALAHVTLTVPAGMMSCIVGASGCGKTTLLMLAAGLIAPRSGTVRLDGDPVFPGDRRIGLILQHYGLFPWFTVRENVELGLRIRAVPPAERRRIVAQELRAVGLEALGQRFPRDLSGGQQQRVAIARAYALQPRLLLMDEPFSALDALGREALQDLLLEAARLRQSTILLVTHSIEEAACLGKVIWVMGGSPGRITARLENPAQGTEGYRRDPEFFRVCTAVRALMQGHVEAS
jgi:NitT/TauT family transport system ATP-binding protein